jgi:hypothetical protein
MPDATVIASANYLAVGLRSSGLSISTNPQLQYRNSQTRGVAVVVMVSTYIVGLGVNVMCGPAVPAHRRIALLPTYLCRSNLNYYSTPLHPHTHNLPICTNRNHIKQASFQRLPWQASKQEPPCLLACKSGPRPVTNPYLWVVNFFPRIKRQLHHDLTTLS